MKRNRKFRVAILDENIYIYDIVTNTEYRVDKNTELETAIILDDFAGINSGMRNNLCEIGFLNEQEKC